MTYLDWADTKYKPRGFDEIQGNEWSVKKLERFAESGNFPHLLLSGPQGTGKSVCAEILAELTDAEWKEWNASDDRRLSDIRTKIKEYAMTKSIVGPFKIAFLDEAGKMRDDAQHAFRRIMETFSENCRFILSVNELYSIIYQVRSRCVPIRFRKLLPNEIYPRLEYIVDNEIDEGNINPNIVSEGLLAFISEKSNGDMRTAIKNLQALLEKRNTPITQKELDATFQIPPTEKVGQMLSSALSGKFSESIKIFEELAIDWNAPDIFDLIGKEFLGSRSSFSENNRIGIAMAIGRLPLYRVQLQRKEIMYSFLAYLASGG